MTKHFEPKAINGDTASGHRFRDVRETMEHYRFIPSAMQGSSHTKFRHREYPQIGRIMRERGAEGVSDSGIVIPSAYIVEPVYVRHAAAACLLVKELNAKRREEESHDPLPAWVEALNIPPFSKSVEGDMLRLFAEPNGHPRRSYRISCEHGKLHVVNLNYPDEYHISFTLSAGDKHPEQSFLRQFGQLDKEVQGHISDREKFFNNLLKRTEENRGFTVTRDDPDQVTTAMIHLVHPQYHIRADLPLTPPNETIANETIYTLEKLRSAHDLAYEAQFTMLDNLAAEGWKITQTPVKHGQVGEVTFTSPKGATFALPLYSDLQMFDMDAASKQIAALETPHSRVSNAQRQDTHQHKNGRQ